jgi:hypothetical protein
VDACAFGWHTRVPNEEGGALERDQYSANAEAKMVWMRNRGRNDAQ